jgi:hypothetical protein
VEGEQMPPKQSLVEVIPPVETILDRIAELHRELAVARRLLRAAKIAEQQQRPDRKSREVTRA